MFLQINPPTCYYDVIKHTVMFALLVSLAGYVTFITGEERTTAYRKLCVGFEIGNYRFAKDVLQTFVGLSRSQCLLRCIRNSTCFAFNLYSGTCELLPANPKCMYPHPALGSTHVSLWDCDGHSPRICVTPDEHSWNWVNASDIWYPNNFVSGQDSGNVFSGVFYVVRVYVKGMLVPGWQYEATRPKVVDPENEERVGCNVNVGEYLYLPDPHTYSWVAYTVGESVPLDAVIGGHGPDCSPLYIVKYQSHVFGYYRASTKKTYFVWGSVIHTTSVSMLVTI